MARIRTIKPETPQSESMGRLSRDARLLFIQLWTIADDAGRMRGVSRALASLLYPFDDDVPALIDGWLTELEREGCIRRYEVNGSHYLEIVNWLKHQKIDRPTPSRLPAFDETSRVVASPREPSRTLAPDLGPVPVPGKDQRNNDSSLRSESAPAAPQPTAVEPVQPVYTDATHEVWSDGVLTLVSLGVPDKRARQMIGKWLKETGDDAAQVLSAIRRARDARSGDPIPLVTGALKQKPHAAARTDPKIEGLKRAHNAWFSNEAREAA